MMSLPKEGGCMHGLQVWLLPAAVAAEASAPMDALDSSAATSVIARLSFGTALPVSDISRSSM